MTTSGPDRTADGRYIIVDGRRWRATDPAIPERLRAELTAELMAARRAVRDHVADARPRVHDAKVALGERGDPWWQEPTEAGRADRVAAAMRTLLRHRAVDATICPSDAARVAGGDRWREAMDAARAVAGRLHEDGTVRITRGGEEVDARAAGGPIRIGRGPAWPSPQTSTAHGSPSDTV